MAVNLETIEKLPLVQKFLIVVGLITVVYVGFYFGYVTGKQDEIDKKEKDLHEIQVKVARGKAVQAKIKEYEEKKIELEQELKDAEKRLPREARIPDLLSTLSNLARGNELFIPSFKPGKISGGCGGICNQIELAVTFTGTYNNIAVFLDQLSKLERIVSVSSMALKPGGKAKKKGSTQEAETKLSATVKMITYMFADKKATTGKKKKKRKRKRK